MNIFLFLIVLFATRSAVAMQRMSSALGRMGDASGVRNQTKVKHARGKHSLLSDLSLPMVCSPSFNADLQSLFVVKDTLSGAKDATVLCEMCASIVRLGIVFLNDERTKDKWEQVIDQNACKYSDAPHRSDCKALKQKLVQKTKKGFFDTSKALLSSKDLKLGSTALGDLIHSRALDVCSATLCCPNDSQGKVQSLIVSREEQRCDPDALQELNLQRKSIKKEHNVLRGMSDALDKKETELFDKEGRLQEWEDELEMRENKLSRRGQRLNRKAKSLQRKQEKVNEMHENALKLQNDLKAQTKSIQRQKRSLNDLEQSLRLKQDQLDNREDNLAEPKSKK